MRRGGQGGGRAREMVRGVRCRGNEACWAELEAGERRSIGQRARSGDREGNRDADGGGWKWGRVKAVKRLPLLREQPSGHRLSGLRLAA